MNNKLDDLMIKGREKRRSKIYKYCVASNRTNCRRDGIPYRVGPTFLKALEFRVLLEFWEIRRGAFW